MLEKKYLKKITSKKYSPSTLDKIIIDNATVIKSITYKKYNNKSKLYELIENYLIENNYLLDKNRYLNFLKENDLKYKDLLKIKTLTTYILIDKLDSIIRQMTTLKTDKVKIAKALNKLSKTNDNSLNKYYPLTEKNTDIYKIYFLNEEIKTLNNPKLFLSFSLSLKSMPISLASYIEEYKYNDALNIHITENIFISLSIINNIDIYMLFNTNSFEIKLNHNSIYKRLDNNSKSIIRKKILHKLNSNKYLDKYNDNLIDKLFSYKKYKVINTLLNISIIVISITLSIYVTRYMLFMVFFIPIKNVLYNYPLLKNKKVMHNKKILVVTEDDLDTKIIDKKLDYLVYTKKKSNVEDILNIIECPIYKDYDMLNIRSTRIYNLNNYKYKKDINTLMEDSSLNVFNYNYISNYCKELSVLKSLSNTERVKVLLYLVKRIISFNYNIFNIKRKDTIPNILDANINIDNNTLLHNVLSNKTMSILVNKNIIIEKYKDIYINKVIPYSNKKFYSLIIKYKDKEIDYIDNIILKKNSIETSYIDKNVTVNTRINILENVNLEVERITIKNNMSNEIELSLIINNEYILSHSINNINYKINNILAEEIDKNTHIFSNNNLVLGVSLLDNRIIKLKKNEERVIYLLKAVSKSKDESINIINKYKDKFLIERDIRLRSKYIENNYNDYMKDYNYILNYLLFNDNNSINDTRKRLLTYNTLGLNNLWHFKITGELPIILLDINSEEISIVDEVLGLFVYLKRNTIYNDLIILIDDGLEKIIEDKLYYIYNAYNIKNSPGSIHVLNKNKLPEDEIVLFYTVARLVIDSRYNSLKSVIIRLNKVNKSTISTHEYLEVEDTQIDEGFSEDGSHYTINNNSNKNYQNIITNNKFGTIINSKGNTYTYYKNSYQYKITPWYRDIKNERINELILINDKQVPLTTTTHGFGYTTYYSSTKDLEITLTEFISNTESIKFYKVDLKNISNKSINLKIKYLLNLVLGDNEEIQNKHILGNYNEEHNLVTFKNVLNSFFNTNTCFISSNEVIKDYNIDVLLEKYIEVEVNIKPTFTKEVDFILGIVSDNNLLLLKEKYANIFSVGNSLTISKMYWNDLLHRIEVHTGNKDIDYMVNGWYLYQTMALINGNIDITNEQKSISYKDSLLDARNIINVDGTYLKERIIEYARYENIKGEVLTSFNKDLNIGVRGNNQSDGLYLIYVVLVYLNVESDIDILKKDINYINIKGINVIIKDSTHKDNLYTHLKRIIDYNIENMDRHKHLLYKAIFDFISITKLYDKNIDMIYYKDVLDRLKSDLISESISINDKYLNNILEIENTTVEDSNDINILYILYLLKKKKYDKAYTNYLKLSPVNNIDIKEPYFSYNIKSSILYKVLIEDILGINRNKDKLFIKPKLSKDIKNIKIIYNYLNTTYKIDILLHQKENCISLDSNTLLTNHINLKNDYRIHIVNIKCKD